MTEFGHPEITIVNYDDIIFEDMAVEEEEREAGEEQAAREGRRKGGRRGPDIIWQEVVRFEDRDKWNSSEEFKELKGFNMKKPWETQYAANETWCCKYSQKAHYQKCPRMVKLEFLNASQEVVLLDNGLEHRHEVDEAHTTLHKKYLWTPRQEEVMMPLVRNKATPTVIMRELQRQDATNVRGIYPNQINTKKKYMWQTMVMENMVLLDTADLMNFINEHSAEPEDPNEAYIVDHTLDVSDVIGRKPRFTVTFATKNLLQRINDSFIQDDATYKMNWAGYPILTHGVSTETGRFFLTHVTLSSHEDTAYANNYSFVKRILENKIPRFRMGDGAWDITNTGTDVFGGVGSRLMCWSHTYRNVRPKLATVRRENKELGESILSDVESIQWMCQTSAKFKVSSFFMYCIF